MTTSSPALAPAAVAETHCATVFFSGDRAYKVKKPVDMGFLDFSTVEQRRIACEREVQLNRRLAPDVYLGVADVVGPDGAVCDHLVVMRRMPDDRRLSTLLQGGDVPWECLRHIAVAIAALHARSATSSEDPAIGEVATAQALAANWADNLAVLDRHAGEVLDSDRLRRVRRLATAYIDGRGPLLAKRIADGSVRDGHGDLLAQDIFCLDDGPRILDCLEFADRYRYGDVLLDVAFLAMDLERLGHPAAAIRFLRWYAEFSGEHHPPTLVDHYVAYRAGVRAKVACLRQEQGAADAGEDARQLLDIALSHLRRGRVVLVLVGGLPGTGKSTVARALSEATGWALLSTDELRKDLAGLAHTDDARADVDAGLYRPSAVAATYQELLARARRLLELGMPVILDASWTRAAQRRAAADVAAATCSDLVQLRCEAPLDLARTRVARRPPATSASDATVDVLAAMASRADPWPDAIAIPTDRSPDATSAAAHDAVHSAVRALEGDVLVRGEA